MSTNFAGKVIAITGAASGIGLATSKMLASRGASLALADLNAALLQTAVEDIKAEAGGEVVGTGMLPFLLLPRS